MESSERPPIPETLYNGMFMEIGNLTPRERHLILDVMIRDERLRKRDQHKINLMKAELQDLRRKGALRPSEDGAGLADGARSCSRCRAELGWIVNRGAVCQACRLRVCRACREYTVRTIDWVCTVCYKRTEIQAATGEWMNEFVKKPGQNRFYMSAADIIKSTIRRSWTISDPTPRWPSSRDSPEFRPYNSLPRGQDVSAYPSLTRTSPEKSPKVETHKIKPSPLSTEKPPEIADEVDEIATKPEEVTTQRQRRVSLFERTLSELYDNGGKRSKKASIDKTEKKNDDKHDNENKKNPDVKPSKIPSPRRKFQTARSDSAAIITKKEPIKKFSSLQNNKKSISNEKHVSFEHVEAEVTVKNSPFKSGIPRRDSKTIIDTRREENNSIETLKNVEETINNEEIDNIKKPESPLPQIETINEEVDILEAETEPEPEPEPVSAAIFRKVAVRRRRQEMKKSQAFDEGSRDRGRSTGCSLDKKDELIELDTGRILLPEGDDYKLVFISSDSSSKEEDADDNDSASSSSAATGHSFSIDDCDWDYFEPSSNIRPVLRDWSWSNRNSPFGSPRVYRRGVLDSPLGSPLVYRRARESDTGTDEDVTRLDSGSPASSDSVGCLSRMRSSSENEDHLPLDVALSRKFKKQTNKRMEEVSSYKENQQLQCKHQTDEPASVTEKCGGGRQVGNSSPPSLWSPPCRSCGAAAPIQSTQFVPIPVLVPIPVPVPASIWNPLDSVILYNTDALDNLRMRIRAIQQRAAGTMLWSGVNPASFISPLISTGDAATLLSVHHSLFTAATEADMSATEAGIPSASERNSDQQHVTDVHAVEATGTGSNPGANIAECAASNSAVMTDNHSLHQTQSSDGVAAEVGPTSEVAAFVNTGGYLQCERTYISSSESSDSNVEQGSRKPRVRRMYNVSGGIMRESDDALPDSDVTSDEEKPDRESQSSVSREDEMSSSGSEETDSDDTGTVADQKPKRFSRVFVVNTNDSSSDVEDNTDSSSNTETSDNDTDTEKDCVILNYMRPLSDASSSDENVNEPVILIKHVKSGESVDCATPPPQAIAANVNSEKLECEETEDSSVVLLKHIMCCDSRENSDDDRRVASEMLVSAKIDTLSDSADDESDNDSSCVKSTGEVSPCENTCVSIKSKPSETCNNNVERIESEHCDQKTHLGSAIKDQVGVDSNVDVIKQADYTPESRNEKNVEFIGDCLQVVTEESKQTAIDLETRVEPDMKVNNSTETVATEHHVSLLAAELPPLSGQKAVKNTDNTSSESDVSDTEERSARSEDGTSESEGDKSPGQFHDVSEVSTASTLASEWNDGTVIRSGDPVTLEQERSDARAVEPKKRGARTGAPLTAVDNETRQCHVPARYTSLVMITQEPPLPQVSVVPSDTTTIIPSDGDVIVRHTNWQNVVGDRDENANANETGLAGYFTVALENPGAERTTPRKTVLVTKTPTKSADSETVTVVTSSDTLLLADSDPSGGGADGVTVVTGGDTLSAVVCLEDGLADDDSWVEDISYDEDEFATTTATDSSSGEEAMLCTTAVVDHEEELRGYHRSAIDFTLHTIVEESCEESEVEQSQPNNKARPTSATDLEKYFFFRLGDGTVPSNGTNREDAYSETSSIYSEGMDSLGTPDDVTNDNVDPAELASSRLEKYFLSGFMGFTAERRDSDGSVGSDSEGRPSPEQRRKRLVRARGTGRSHSSSLDNLLASAELSGTEQQLTEAQHASENSSSSETDTLDELSNNFEKSDGQFDTVKRKKCKKQRVITGGSNSPQDERKGLETTMEETYENKDSEGDEDGHKTPQPEFLLPVNIDLANSRKQQSRDSGFIGSCDDLLKEQKTNTENSNESSPSKTLEKKKDLEKISEEKNKTDERLDKSPQYTAPPATSLTRKDSFNNWSSDEETNLMMSKMRQFFKTMIANNSNAHLNTNSKPTTPILTHNEPPRPVPSPRTKNRSKPPQLVYFENELTRLMKTVPGIRDDQVREIVEYLSSEDTWSDSYDSSDYTSSDLECATVAKSALQEQISASCQQIINKFDNNVEDEEGDEGDGGILDESQGLNRETAFVYQKLVASFNKMASGDAGNIENSDAPHNSPPLIAKVMHHIGSRLVALMHEVSSGESHCSTSPKVRYHHRRLQQKLSSASTTTTEDDDSTSDSNLPDHLTALEDGIAPYNLLPRSRSHDLLLGEARAHHQSSSGVSDIAEEREASDYERFSWRGSFESALMATDSRQKLSLLGAEGSASVSALAMAAKRRSAGDLLFSPKSLSREQLDRVRSCGSIGGGNSEDKHWVVTPVVRPTRRRSSVPDATCGSGGSADGEDDDEDDIENRSTTLPRSLQTGTATTNSLPRLPTTANAANMHKAHSMHHFLQHNVKSARYRPPGFNRAPAQPAPKRAVSAPGLQPSHPRREVRRRSQQPAASSDDVSIADSNSSPIVGLRSSSKSASPSPIHSGTLNRGTGSISSADWQNNEDDIDRLVAMHHNRSSLSSLGLRSDSMASVYSGAGEGRYGNVAVRGQVEFGLQYNYKAGALEIHVKQCRDLAAVDVKRYRSDPYVKVYLLPDKSKSGKRKTKVKKHTLNPVFDESLKFHSTLSGLETRTLWLTVWHSDMFGRNDFLGEVMMALENKVFDEPTPKWYNLQERTEPFEELPSYKGDIVVGLKFVPPDMTIQKKGKRSRGALHVLVKEAKNLTAVKVNGTSDPFCKSYLLPDKGRSNKQKTPILKRTTSPVWNHSFVYDDVTLQELAERSLELTVWDHDRIASNEFLGGVRFSLATGKHYGKSVDWMDASGKELLLWQSMLERPNFWVEGCVSLRSSLDHRSY